MARGWESKTVEQQIEDAHEERNASKAPEASPVDMEARQKSEGLCLQRTRILQELATSRNPRYRALLAEMLRHLESQLQP
jgi:hypothetical protein